MTNYYPKYRNIHRPPHIYLDDIPYFITSRTCDRLPFFNTDRRKELLANTIREATQQFGCKLHAWVVLKDHYHILLDIHKGANLPKLLKAINGRSSRRLRQQHNSEGRLISLPSGAWKVWRNYWDHGIRDERDFYTHLNYIHHNPVKHKYVKKMEDYKFSSYNDYLLKYGQEWLNSCFEQYPIIDFTVDEN